MNALAMQVLLMVIGWLSPVARKALSDALQGWYAHALATPNKMDDIAAKVVVSILSVDVSKVVATPSPDSANLPPEVVNAVSGGLLEVITGRPFDATVDSP